MKKGLLLILLLFCFPCLGTSKTETINSQEIDGHWFIDKILKNQQALTIQNETELFFKSTDKSGMLMVNVPQIESLAINFRYSIADDNLILIPTENQVFKLLAPMLEKTDISFFVKKTLFKIIHLSLNKLTLETPFKDPKTNKEYMVDIFFIKK